MEKKFVWTRKGKFQFIETFCYIFISLISFYLAYIVMHLMRVDGQGWFEDVSLLAISLMSVINTAFIILIDSQLKSSVIVREYLPSLFRSILAILLVDVISFFIFYYSLGKNDSIGLILLTQVGISFVSLAIVRLIIHLIYVSKKVTIAVIGTKVEVEWVSKKLLIDNRNKRKIKYLIFEENIKENVSNVFKYLDECDEIYLANGLSENNRNQVFMHCVSKRISVHIIPTMYEIGVINSLTSQVDDALALDISGFNLSFTQRLIKRAFDIVCSIIGIIVFSPLMALVAIIIKCQDGGSPIFKQERLTLNGKKFTVLKFRTMIMNAEKSTGVVLASANDKRITKFGKFIRRTRIDELPQLFNVLKGEMSFIGPRPERDEYVQEFLKRTPSYKFRMNVKAGITGLAQVKGNYSTDYRDKLRLDLLYIKEYSFLLDVKIFFLTFIAVFNRNSAKGRNNQTLSLEEFFNKFNHTLEPFEAGYIVSKNVNKTNNKVGV